MQTSDSIDKIAPALVKAQGDLLHAVKDSNNDAFKRGGKALKYADLAAVWDAVKPALSANKLAALQDVVSNENGMGVRTRILHESGQWIEFDPPIIPLTKRDAHGAGSALTYGRRYSLSAALGVVADDDDDGNAAAKSQGDATTRKNPPGRSAAVNDVRAAVREMHACGDADSLLAYINTDDFKRFAFKICRDFPNDWLGPEDSSGLSGSLAHVGIQLGCEAETTDYIARMESAARSKQQAAE